LPHCGKVSSRTRDELAELIQTIAEKMSTEELQAAVSEWKEL
jgi:hypothetical protein